MPRPKILLVGDSAYLSQPTGVVRFLVVILLPCVACESLVESPEDAGIGRDAGAHDIGMRDGGSTAERDAGFVSGAAHFVGIDGALQIFEYSGPSSSWSSIVAPVPLQGTPATVGDATFVIGTDGNLWSWDTDWTQTTTTTDLVGSPSANRVIGDGGALETFVFATTSTGTLHKQRHDGDTWRIERHRWAMDALAFSPAAVAYRFRNPDEMRVNAFAAGAGGTLLDHFVSNRSSFSRRRGIVADAVEGPAAVIDFSGDAALLNVYVVRSTGEMFSAGFFDGRWHDGTTHVPPVPLDGRPAAILHPLPERRIDTFVISRDGQLAELRWTGTYRWHVHAGPTNLVGSPRGVWYDETNGERALRVWAVDADGCLNELTSIDDLADWTAQRNMWTWSKHCGPTLLPFD